MTLRYESKAEEDARTHLFLNHLLLQLGKLRAQQASVLLPMFDHA